MTCFNALTWDYQLFFLSYTDSSWKGYLLAYLGQFLEGYIKTLQKKKLDFHQM